MTLMTLQLKRELQLYDEGRATCDFKHGFDIDEPHILFDVNLEGAMENFLNALETYYQPEAVLQQYQAPDESGAPNPFFVFSQAIDRVLGLDDSQHNTAADIALENIYGHDPSAFDTWEDLAAAWLGQYLNAYNQQLKTASPERLDDLRRVITELRREDGISDTEILTIVKKDLEMNPYEGRY